MGSSGHEEGELGVFWAWVEGATSNMALAFEGLVEQVRSWTIVGGLSGLGLSSIMDTLNTLLIGWLVFVVLILILSSFFYVKFVQTLQSDALGKSRQGEVKEETDQIRAAVQSSSESSSIIRSPVARKPTIVPDGPPDHASPPVATGADPDAVNWTNNIFTWLFNSADGGPTVRKIFLDTLNSNTVKTALEIQLDASPTGILVEVAEVYKASPAPLFSNMVVDCSPTDNITITCDCDVTVYLRLLTTRTQKDVTTESEYACAVTRLRGRLNVAIITEELMAVVKFDGWPEVSLELEGIRNNAVGLDEQQMKDVIDEVITSALRNSVYDVNFQPVQTFPRFRRARQAPDRIIPVGYDSMVREKQTHPPSVPKKAPKPKPALMNVIHDEEIEVAGESFTAITFPSSLSQQIALTTSEEQLIQRNLNKYPSLEKEMTECHKSWEENYVPAAEIPEEEEEVEEMLEDSPPAEVSAPPKLEEKETSSSNFVLVVSSRQKLIDEPRSAISVEEVEEVEEPTPARNIDEEPCLRRGDASILGQPKVEEPVHIEEEEEDLDEPLRLEDMDFMDKSMTATSGFGPLPSLPGLQKGPFVSEACHVGLKVDVATELPKLDPRLETAAIDQGVASDLSECDQEVEVPVQTFSHTPLYNQAMSDDPSLCCGSDVANTLSGAQVNPFPSSSPSSEPDKTALPELVASRRVESYEDFSSFYSQNRNEGMGVISLAESKEENYSSLLHVANDSCVEESDTIWESTSCSKVSYDSDQENADLSGSEQYVTEQEIKHNEDDECEVKEDLQLSKKRIKDVNETTLCEFTENLFKPLEVQEFEKILLDEIPNEEARQDQKSKSETGTISQVSFEDECEDKDEGFDITKMPNDCKDQNISSKIRTGCDDFYFNRHTYECDKQETPLPIKNEENLRMKDIGNNQEEDVLERTYKKDMQGYTNKREDTGEKEVLDEEELKEDARETQIYYGEKVTEHQMWETGELCLDVESGSIDLDDIEMYKSHGDSSISQLHSAECVNVLKHKTQNLTELNEFSLDNVREGNKKNINIFRKHMKHQMEEMDEDVYIIKNEGALDRTEEYEKLRKNTDDQILLSNNTSQHQEELSSKWMEGEDVDDSKETCETYINENFMKFVNNSSNISEFDREVFGDTFFKRNDMNLVEDAIVSSDEKFTNTYSTAAIEEKLRYSEEKLKFLTGMLHQIQESEPFKKDSTKDVNGSDIKCHESIVEEQLQPSQVNYTLLVNSSSDSEIEEIINACKGDMKNDLLYQQTDLRTEQTWRKSDIIEIAEESQVSIMDNDPVDTNQISGTEIQQLIEANMHTSSDDLECPLPPPAVFTKADDLTVCDTTILTSYQKTSYTGRGHTTRGDSMIKSSVTSGQPQWTRSLPSYPVYGTYYVTLQSSTTGQSLGIPGLNGKRLLVKIVKATGVGCEKAVSEGYTVVEMDEPPQKFTTSVIKDTNSPFWDEQFLFDLSDGTLELLFELYDKKDGNFLGLGIVGIEELVATPSQRQIIPLQSRPYENDEVSGSLTVEFLFLDRADLPDLTLRSSATSQSLSSKGDLVTTTTTTYVKAPDSQDVIVNGGDGVAAAALRDIEEKKVVVANNASKSTMIIHASRKELAKKVIQVERAPSGEYKELIVQPEEDDGYEGQPVQDLTALTTTATTTTATRATVSPNKGAASTTQSPTITMSTATTNTTVVTNADGGETADIDERGRSRGNRRKRDSFFGTLKKRFSRSKVRSKSMEPGSRDLSMDRDMSVGRSISMERTANRASEEEHENPSPLRDTLSPRESRSLLAVPASAGGDGGSTRSSLSDASAISSSSTRTYVNEASTLIVETRENGVLKHYLIPLSLQQKSKWRKKGLKLHVFNEHTFVAKHMSSTTPCQVCQKTLGRRFGKQGYECRDCGFKSHKPCHVKTDTVCPNSTVNTMDLEYVKDPREERKAWIKKVKSM
ncbi:uncharacterized protein LOC122256440 isoform X4 [Penaeus japonicus]|uniref:uncharacterized protein LOC122256440 isoform X4 n=1 Tax=Penaeus japonicus TaxID=27405 RepID=UPI001C712FFB|nr:uncharacterized protein LOC122256440 isoform X4 [Penaeus japonicus]